MLNITQKCIFNPPSDTQISILHHQLDNCKLDNYRHTQTQTHTHTHTTVWWPLVWDYLGRPLPEETFTHSQPSWSSDILHQLPASTMIRSILFVQFTCLTVLFPNLSKSSLVLDRLLHTQCISSPNHHLLFTAHAHTIAACSDNYRVAQKVVHFKTPYICGTVQDKMTQILPNVPRPSGNKE